MDVASMKRLHHILGGQGWIDENKVSQYKKIAKDKDDKDVKKTPLLRFIHIYIDAANDLTKSAVMIDKWEYKISKQQSIMHIAGECIMYSWGVAKIIFRKIPILEKIADEKGKFK